MNVKNIYREISKNRNYWEYYNSQQINAPNIGNKKECCNFIREYINLSEKVYCNLYKDINNLNRDKDQFPRSSHIVSTFFLGLYFFKRAKCKYIRKNILEKIGKLSYFSNKREDTDKQFTYIWFMTCLFHDLGYKKEYKGAKIPNHEINDKNISIPIFFRKVYKKYYEYRKQKEHGIYAGLTFDRDLCEIRSWKKGNTDSELYWGEELEELYHYVAWVILAHNIWMIREGSEREDEYKMNELNCLILQNEKFNNVDVYKEYNIKFEDYPLFVFFCIIDSIDPIKSPSCLLNVDIKLEKDKTIIIKSDDSKYIDKLMRLNEWLAPTTKNEEGDTVTIYLSDYPHKTKNV